MLEFCQNIAKIDSKVTIESIAGKELCEKGLNLIYSVGRGAARAPNLVILKYEGMIILLLWSSVLTFFPIGNPQNKEDVIALVGKGVCFDAGGLNLKPTGAIEEMWMDKGI